MSMPALPDRWVIFDTETTGTTPTRDRMVSIGALAIQGKEIVPEDSFECVIRIPFNSSSVVVHGITKEETQRHGIEEAEAIHKFSEYIGDACLVGHHVAFDVIVTNHARVRHGLPMMENGAVDIMELVMALEEIDAIPRRADPHNYSLDGLLDLFGVGKSGRHTAMGDSLLTALIFLKLLSVCKDTYADTLRSNINTSIGLGNQPQGY